MSLIISAGAGADGKTTIVELLAKYHVLQGNQPLVIDANPDQNLCEFIGVADSVAQSMPKICDHFEDIRNALEGDNADYPNKDYIVDVSPLTPSSKRWDASNNHDPLLSQFSHLHDDMLVMRTGTYEAKDIGSGCLHDKIGALTFLLNHMQDGNGKHRMTYVDNAHGRDAFGTPLYALGDAIMIVVKPEKKSVDILRDYLSMARQVEQDIGFYIPVIVVGNKLSNDRDEFDEEYEYLNDASGGNLITAFEDDKSLRRRFTNVGPSLDKISPLNMMALDTLAQATMEATRDYKRRREWTNLCLGRAAYLDKLVSPDVRQQKSTFVPSDDHQPYLSCGCAPLARLKCNHG